MAQVIEHLPNKCEALSSKFQYHQLISKINYCELLKVFLTMS
jgi:hypothetical protein